MSIEDAQQAAVHQRTCRICLENRTPGWIHGRCKDMQSVPLGAQSGCSGSQSSAAGPTPHGTSDDAHAAAADAAAGSAATSHHMSTYTVIHVFIRLFVHMFNSFNSFICSFIHTSIHALICPFMPSFIHSCVHLFIHMFLLILLSMHSCISVIHPLTVMFFHSCTACSSNHSFLSQAINL